MIINNGKEYDFRKSGRYMNQVCIYDSDRGIHEVGLDIKKLGDIFYLGGLRWDYQFLNN